VSSDITAEARDANVAAVAGTTVTLMCATTSSQQVRWNFRAVESKKLLVVHSGSEINPELVARHAVIPGKNTGRSRLVIVNVQLSDAGSYSCMLQTSTAKMFNTELTVIGDVSTQSAL